MCVLILEVFIGHNGNCTFVLNCVIPNLPGSSTLNVPSVVLHVIILSICALMSVYMKELEN